MNNSILKMKFGVQILEKHDTPKNGIKAYQQ